MKTPTPTHQELQSILQSSASADEKGWSIYRFLKDNIGDNLPSVEARTLLAEYIKLKASRPSLLHSMMLSSAIKMAEIYPDFRLTAFVDTWGIDNLRSDDLQRHTDDRGHSYHSLAERLTVAILRYVTTHPVEEISDTIQALLDREGSKLGFIPPRPMAAVKMFESQREGRKMRMVRLVGADGTEMACDWRIFRTKPWEITGRMYQVLPRRAEKSGNVRVDTLAPTPASPADVFGAITGYVDSFDNKHKHYHIFDRESRHFVAESPAVRINVGDYVTFAPVVPAEDPFKSALVLSAVTKDDGRQAFGATEAKVEYTNTEKGYFAYNTPAGERAYGKLTACTRPIQTGDTVLMTVYMRRGSDGQKRPHVADVY